MTKTVTVAKAVAAPKAKTTAKAVAKAPVAKALFVLTDIARPVSGARLYAHTFAAMTVLGMIHPSRPAVPRAALQAFVGARAISYHTKQTQSLAEVGDRIRLSETGAFFFADRFAAAKVDQKSVDAFVGAFTKGVADAAIAVKASALVPVSLTL